MTTHATAADELRQQFYEWEAVGRGGQVFPHAVHLEPPFRPFLGHYLARPDVPDDGRRPSPLGRIASLLSGESESTAVVPRSPTARDLRPRFMEGDLPLRSFVLHVPRERVVRGDAMSACLSMLRSARFPIAFEVVGTGGMVVVQFVVRAPDEAILAGALRSYFPDVAAMPTDLLDAAFDPGRRGMVGVFELGLTREFMLPLGVARSFDPDPLIAVVASLEDAKDDEAGALQILFEGARSPWAESVFRAVSHDDGSDFFYDAPEIARGGKQKFMQSVFAATIRIAVVGPTDAMARARLRRLTAALEQFETMSGNRFRLLPGDPSFSAHEDLLLRQSHRSGMLLGLDELQSIVHLPSASLQSKALAGRSGMRTHGAPHDAADGLLLGTNRHAGGETPVYLSLDRARRHVHILGASGSGKSNLLLQLLLEQVRHGGGVALLDPHGDLVDDLLSRMPDERVKDVIVFDPGDAEYPVGFNVLAAHSELEKTLLASDLVAIFRRLSTSWGDQMHAVFANAIIAFLESSRGGTIAELRKFLVDAEFRREFLTTIEDEDVVYYWTREFPLLKGQPQGPILTRLDSFLRPKLVRQMVAQREMKIDFRTVMDEGKIFLAKLAQGAIGEENAALLGSFLMARLHQTAMSRQNIRAAERRPFLIVADECQHFVTPSMAAILSGARKFAVGLVLSHQDQAQLQRKDTEVFTSLMGNAGTRIVFRVGDADARSLADGFEHFTADNLRSLATGEAICRFDRADWDFNMRVPLAAPVDEAEAALRRARIVAASRTKYATPFVPKPKEPAPRPEDRDLPPIANTLTTDVPQRPKEPAPRVVRESAPPQKDEATLGRGGAKHKYLQELVKRFAEAQGYRATIEKPTADGGSVDVALEREDGSIAVEISVTSTAAYETANVAKCLAAGYSRVVLLAPDEKRVASLKKAVRATLAPADAARVDFLRPEEFLTALASTAGAVVPEQTVGGYKVKVSYAKTTIEDAKARERAVAEVVAKSVRKMEDE